jgi:hypothetical protein
MKSRSGEVGVKQIYFAGKSFSNMPVPRAFAPLRLRVKKFVTFFIPLPATRRGN